MKTLILIISFIGSSVLFAESPISATYTCHGTSGIHLDTCSGNCGTGAGSFDIDISGWSSAGYNCQARAEQCANEVLSACESGAYAGIGLYEALDYEDRIIDKPIDLNLRIRYNQKQKR